MMVDTEMKLSVKKTSVVRIGTLAFCAIRE